uniref:Mpv17-like protein 2 n=1 Tax=Strongyloides stercoralis TaxID=6248 RepID=A0A0K0EMJ1_STRER
MIIKKKFSKINFKSIHMVVNKIYSTKYIYLSNVITTSGFFIIGDALSQYITRDLKEKFKLDHSRMLRLSFVGGNIGFMTTIWYKFLDGSVKHPNKYKRNFVKIVADFCVSPIFSSFCIVTSNLLDGKTLKNSVKEYTSQWKRIIKTDLCIWPPFQFFNFFLIDPKFRVLYVASVNVIYSCCISYFANKNKLSKIC